MMKRQSRRFLCIGTPVFTLFLLGGCGDGGAAGDSNEEPGVLSNDVLDSKINLNVTRADADQLTQSINQAIQTQNGAGFHKLIDEGVFFDRVLMGLEMPANARQGFITGFRSSGGLQKIGQQVVDAVQNGGSYSLVRYIEEDGTIKPLFRLAFPEAAGVNYHKLTIFKTNSGQIRIADMFVYMTGEPISQTIRRLIIPMVVHQNRNLMDRLSGTENEYVKNLPKLQRMQQAIQAQQFPQALSIFKSFPASLQKDRSLLMMRLVVAQQVSDEEYKKTMEMFQSLGDNDPSSDFRSIDYYAMTNQHEKVLSTIDRLKAVLKDPYLDMLKADSYAALGRVDEGRSVLAEVRKALPKMEIVRFTQIGLALEAKDFKAVADELTSLKRDLNVPIDVEGVPEYAEFRQSAAYREWKQRQ